MNEIHRFADADDLADRAAAYLLRSLIELQEGGQRVAQLCLTGGRIANRLYERLGALVESSDLDPALLGLWWGDEGFVPTDHADRNAGPTLGLLAGQFPLAPARTHPMPAADGLRDNAESAATYAKELGDVTFDICLLGMGEDGHIAAIFPHHPSFVPHDGHTVIGVDDAPKPPAQRISLTLPTINRSREVWFLISGEEKADALGRALAGDEALPAGLARGREATRWFVDAAAVSRANLYDCAF